MGQIDPHRTQFIGSSTLEITNTAAFDISAPAGCAPIWRCG
uniref:NADH-ubiquinone oxidoreductase 20 kDa subunit, mitochondrial n=1 Tax=Arundo donax TaxID=35708 RepID=A0A0A8ZFS0_ARUDO